MFTIQNKLNIRGNLIIEITVFDAFNAFNLLTIVVCCINEPNANRQL